MIRITYQGNTKEIEADTSASILDLVQKNFDCELSRCAKKGSCGRCACRVERGGRSLELLSCCTVAQDGDEIECRFSENRIGLHKSEERFPEISYEVPGAEADAVDGLHKFEVSVHDNRGGLHGTEDLGPGSGSGLHNYAAIDLGTTSIAIWYKGRSEACINPQVRFGADVVSRMSFAQSGKSREIKELTLSCISDLLCKMDFDGRMEGAFIASNTAMLHLLMGYDTTKLGCAPFVPVSMGGESFVVDRYRIYTLPGASAFIGSDVVSGVYFVENAPGYDGEDYLLIDLGTNAEMVYKKGDAYSCLSAAAGPAFSGDASLDLEGSEMLSLVAKGLRAGVIDHTGLLADEFFDKGYPVEGQVLLQKHIRNIQLAKAAVACGAEYLTGRKETSGKRNRIYITGAFGYHLRAGDMIATGLVPGAREEDLTVPGNSSLKGIISAVLKEKTIDIYMKKLQDIVSKMSVISLPDLEDFGERYYEAMGF